MVVAVVMAHAHTIAVHEAVSCGRATVIVVITIL
jgi:hypothetical protein